MADLKRKLARAEEQIASKRDEKKALVKEREKAKEAFAGADSIDTTSEEFKAADEAVKAVSTVDQELSELESSRVGILRMLSIDDPAPNGNGNRPESKPSGWDVDGLLDTPAYKALAASAGSKSRFGSVQLGEVADRETLGQMLSGGSFVGQVDAAAFSSGDAAGLIQPDRRGLLAPRYRPLRLLDLIPTGATDTSSVEYVQVTKYPEEAAEVSEGSRKPEASIAFEDADAPIRTIAEWIKFKKQSLADAAGLRSFINTALPYDVRRRLEAQVIKGNGVGENIEGILEVNNTLEPAVSGSNADRVHNGITAIQLVDLEPTVVVLNPLDFEHIRLSRDASGAGPGTGGYLFGDPAVSGARTLWGLATVLSPVIPHGTAIVCDPNGALILIREGLNVLVSDSDQDDFIHNRVTILAEMRAGLVVFRPDAFAIVDLTFS